MSSQRRPGRPNIMGTRHLVAAGHYLAAQAGFLVLEAGGNAIDAGVAAGLALNVVESQMCCFSGVAPIMMYLAGSGDIVTIDGLGSWPRAASCEFFRQHHPGPIPEGILQTVVPAAADAWITALDRYGTMSFGDVAASAIRFARDGFPMHPQMADRIKETVDDFLAWPANAAIFLPGGRPPGAGDVFVQRDLGRTLQFLADEEAAAAKRGRQAGLRAVRDAFYRGDIAAKIVQFQREQGGLLSAEDMASYRVTVEPPVRTRFRDIDVYSCGPWCQGPMLLQELNLLQGIELRDLGHNSPAYIHTVTEAIKLAAADREAYYGDPRFVDVPIDVLLSHPYADRRRALIRPDQAWPEMPPAGDTGSGQRPTSPPAVSHPAPAGVDRGLDTTYVCVVDRHGNAFSATPSDGVMRKSPIVPGTGLAPSSRGNQSRTDPRHPACVAPGKRPRLTPNPSLVIRQGDFVMPFGTPGGDLQTQAMLQVFLNMFVFGMDPQSAVEAPRVASYSFPDSFSPHPYYPGLLRLEPAITEPTGSALAALGHVVEWWPEQVWSRTAVCAIRADRRSGILHGAADHRRTSYAVGW